MSNYEVKWLVQDRVALFRAVNTPTIEQLHQATDDLTELIDSGHAPVHVVSVTLGVDDIPTDLSAIKKLMSHNPKSGITVVISEKALARFIGTVLTGMAGGQSKAFSNIQDGLDYLNSKDNTLPSLTSDMIA